MINAIKRDGWQPDYQWANIYTIDLDTGNKILTISVINHDGHLIFTDNNGKELNTDK